MTNKKKKLFSNPFMSGIYQFEFREDRIEISRWDVAPTSTTQWVKVSGGGLFRFEGTSPEDIRVVSL